MTNLNFYRFGIENNKGEAQILDRFNGEVDFLNIVEEFCNHTFQEIHNYIDNSGRLRSFSLASQAHIDRDRRYVMGVFEPGFTGEKFKIKDGETNSVKLNVLRKDLQSRELFTLIYVPKGSKSAYLCIQKKENFSIKTVIGNTLNQFLKKSGYSGYSGFRLNIENAPNYNYLRKMMEIGELKEIRLITDKPLNFDRTLYLNALNKVRVDRDEHVLKIGKSSDNSILKNELAKVFSDRYSEFQKVYFLGSSDGFDEISFVLSLGKITKTFYVKDKSKIRSNMDVTNLVDIVDGEVVLDSLIKACFICIGNIEDSSFDDIDDVA